MKALIVDDEKRSIEGLKALLENYVECVSTIMTAFSVDEAIGIMETYNPQIIFLDIDMPEKDGFALIEAIDDTNIGVVFTTAYEEFAIRAFKTNALAYLLKPIDVDDLIAACSKVKNRIVENENKMDIGKSLSRALSLMDLERKVTKIAIAGVKVTEYWNIEEILACVADGNYTTIHSVNGNEAVVSKAISYYEEKLPDHMFMRIHAKFIINLKRIIKYEKGRGGLVYMENGKTFSVAARRRDQFLEKMNAV